jgi:WD40 repeat protein
VYIPRQADAELLKLCENAVFAYVLTPRQMGKSSLMVRTAETLVDRGIRSVIVDLQELGAQVTPEQWYFGFLVKLDDQLMFETDVVGWWREHEHLGISQRLTLFFEQVLLTEVSERVVVFVDEIDSTLSLDFTDDFFIAVRYLYVARATQPEFNRLSFVLLGVATPGDLIRDAKRTPFNIGQRVDLTDFTFEEALPLADGLGLASQEAQQVLGWVLEWTGGHPYLTQRLCGALSPELGSGKSAINQTLVEQIVSSIFLGVMSEQDHNLQFVRDMLTKRSPDPEVLTIYRQIRLGRGSVVDEEQSIAKSHLKLAGIVRTEAGILRLRNRIYRQVFDRRWINQHLPFNLRDRWEQFKPVLPYMVGLLLILLCIAVVALIAFNASNVAEKERLKEKHEADVANQERKLAEKGEKQAKSAQKLAEQRRVALQSALLKTKSAEQLALQQKQVAENQKRLAQQRGVALQSALLKTKSAEQLALQQKQVAENQKRAAILAKADADKQRVNAEISSDSYKAQNLLNANLELEALVTGLKFGKQLKNSDKNVESDTRALAVSTLDQLVYGVQEHNRLEGHSNYVYSVAFSPDGKTIASASYDNTVKLWNRQGQLLHTFEGHSRPVLSVAFSPDGKTIASASYDKTVKLWNLQGQLLHTFQGHSDAVNSVAFSPDGKTIASASYDNTVKLWNLQGQLLHTFEGHSRPVWSVAFSPDGKTIASASYDNTVKLWNLQGQLLQTFPGHSGPVWSVAFSPDGKTIASASADKTVKLWNLQGQLFHTFPGHSSYVNSVAFSPDGKTIASASYDNTVKLWNLQGQLLQTFPGHSSYVNSVAFSPDGKTIASASADNTVKLWNLQGQLLHTFQGHSSSVLSVAFSPDGKTIASASADKTVKLWNLQGQLLQTFPGHSDFVTSVAFSPDGKTIASASDDNTVKLWNLDLDDLLSKGCNWVSDYLHNNPSVREDRHLCDAIEGNTRN